MRVQERQASPAATEQDAWDENPSLPSTDRRAQKASIENRGSKAAESTTPENRDKLVERLTETGLTKLNTALAQGQSDVLKSYLAFSARFHRYSFRNCLLMLAQRPDATQVASYSKWKEMGRQVKRGEKGMTIVAPFIKKQQVRVSQGDGQEQTKEVSKLSGFTTRKVFDIAQTDGEPVPEFSAISGDPGELLSRLEQLVMDSGISLSYETPPEPGVLGTSSNGRVTVRPGLSDAETFAVLTHEFAHELLHKGERRHETSHTIRETEAEAVAFVVSNAIGLDGLERSSDYIALHRGTNETLSESLNFIQKTAQRILKGISDD